MGINPLPFTEIEAWARLYGVSLSLFELDALEALDACYVQHFNKRETK